jgi:hypothetical protein
MEEWRGAFARARSVPGRVRRLGLGSFCEIRAWDGGEVVLNALAIAASFTLESTVGSAHHLFEIADAEVGEVGSFGRGFIAVVALGLETAKLGGRFMKEPAGLRAGAIDGSLAAFGGFVVEIYERGFDETAAAQAPHGAENFLDQVFFHQSGGAKFGVEGFFELGVDGLFAGTDQGAGGEESGGEGVLRRGGFTFFGGGTCG